ncbi:hypothetical protein I79_007285 [Cricetulus griseus]|uniref:Uncharacterized protein n=1 Tax=Cricetulus griseus TaxID=10029 RepID=G3HA43_CRIGR|nr:hypothetical protein I79_007285 [Cricetulus griseus]
MYQPGSSIPPGSQGQARGWSLQALRGLSPTRSPANLRATATEPRSPFLSKDSHLRTASGYEK